MTDRSIPIIIAPVAVASEVPFWRLEPIHSQATGTPTHRTRLPKNIIATSSTAACDARRARRRGCAAGGELTGSRVPRSGA